jgi:hypothetical protein
MVRSLVPQMGGVNAPSCHLYIPVYPIEWWVVKNNYAEGEGPRYKVNSKKVGSGKNGTEIERAEVFTLDQRVTPLPSRTVTI